MTAGVRLRGLTMASAWALVTVLISGSVQAKEAAMQTAMHRGNALDLAGYTAKDAMFARPFIDKDELRKAGDQAYRHVHGGFEGTDTRFAFYFPLKGWGGRFFQYITPVPDSEILSEPLTGEEDRIGAALASGAYFVATNGGGPKAADPFGGMDQTIGAYRANAASALFSRFVATQVYGSRRKIYGYAYGGSGGAYRTLGALENTRGVWDGAVPYVLGSPMAIPNMFTVRLRAMRLVGAKLDGVVDAIDAGGGGDPYAGLDARQQAALREVTRMGFPMPSWYAWKTMGPHAFALLFGAIRMVDKAYFTDFWTRPGYEGHDSPQLYADARVRQATTISEVITADAAEKLGLDIDRSPGTAQGTADLAWRAMGLTSGKEMPVALRLADVPVGKPLLLSDLVLPSGEKLLLSDVKGNIALIGINDPQLVGSVRAGQAVTLENSDILAVETYHRHQVPPADGQYPTWDQFRNADGSPMYAQRKMILGPLFTRNASGSVPSGKYEGKVILIENLWDREALPWQGDWYRRRVEAEAGAGADDRFRIWYIDRALHGDQTRQDDPSRAVSYLGALHQALRDLSAWVETGKAPPASTNYKVVDGQVQLPAKAAERRGIQPVVTLRVNGGLSSGKVAIEAGQSVRLDGLVEVPGGTGSVVAAQWDFEGDGTYDADVAVPEGTGAKLETRVTQRYDVPGTYFAVLRAASQRQGDRNTPFARVQNLARVRVIVR